MQWSDQGMASSFKFILKLWTLHQKIKKKIELKNEEKGDIDKDIEKYVNQLINKINKNLENFQYNVIVANFYQTYNFLNKEIEKKVNSTNLMKNYTNILKLMNPFIPHFSSECLEDIKSNNKEQRWPEVDKEYLKKDIVIIVIQINGKKRTILEAPRDIEEKTVVDQIKQMESIKKYIVNKNIKKTIYVKNRLINIII